MYKPWRYKVEIEVQLHSFLDWALDGGECSASSQATGYFTSRERVFLWGRNWCFKCCLYEFQLQLSVCHNRMVKCYRLEARDEKSLPWPQDVPVVKLNPSTAQAWRGWSKHATSPLSRRRGAVLWGWDLLTETFYHFFTASTTKFIAFFSAQCALKY